MNYDLHMRDKIIKILAKRHLCALEVGKTILIDTENIKHKEKLMH